MIQIIGVPFDLCGRRFGSRLGPSALRLAGIGSALQHLGFEVSDGGDIAAEPERTASGGLVNFAPLLACVEALRKRVKATLEGNHLPLVLGGEHTIVTGGIAAAVEAYGGDLAILWIDAHADLNTPSTSPSGNLHGMPLSVLFGLPSGIEGTQDAEWSRLLEAVGSRPRLAPSRTAWFGLREVDEGERRFLQGFEGGLPITMYDIDRWGMVAMLEKFDRWMRDSGAKRLWISFDVDALDPIEAPGTGTAVRGGLSYREGHLLAEMIREFLNAKDCPYSLAGVDLVEANPLGDTNNETAIVAVEWVASLFGKTILGTGH